MTREKAYEIIDRCPICTECDASFPYNCDECGEAFLTAFDALKQPEIIRCKDCRFGYVSEFAPPELRDIWCCARNHILSTVKPDFFCADGERKEGEQDV